MLIAKLFFGPPVEAGRRTSFLADQRGAVALEMPAVWLFMMMCLLLPLADLAIAGFQFISAHQALRDMGQRTQYSTPTLRPNSITVGKLATHDGRWLSDQCEGLLRRSRDRGPLRGATWPKYYIFQTSFTLSPMVLGSVLCSTCTVNYSQRFQ